VDLRKAFSPGKDKTLLPPQQPQQQLHPSSVATLRLLKDETFLLSSSSNGRVRYSPFFVIILRAFFD